MSLLLKAFPELLSAAILLDLWVEPQRLGIDWFRSGVLALLLEFFVIHAGGFMAVLMYDPETPRGKRGLQVGGIGLGYLVFISAFAWGFDAWWMLVAFIWLCFGKIQAIWTGKEPTERDRTRGVWEAEPHRALAGGVLYFALMGLSRPLLAWAFMPRPTR